MNIIKSICVSLMLGHIFKDNEGIYAYQYNIQSLCDLNTSTFVALFKSVDLFY